MNRLYTAPEIHFISDQIQPNYKINVIPGNEVVILIVLLSPLYGVGRKALLFIIIIIIVIIRCSGLLRESDARLHTRNAV